MKIIHQPAEDPKSQTVSMKIYNQEFIKLEHEQLDTKSEQINEFVIKLL